MPESKNTLEKRVKSHKTDWWGLTVQMGIDPKATLDFWIGKEMEHSSMVKSVTRFNPNQQVFSYWRKLATAPAMQSTSRQETQNFVMFLDSRL